MNQIETLFKHLECVDVDSFDFQVIEANIFAEIYYAKQEIQEQKAIIAYLTISNWDATSFRSGVWTFYEVANMDELRITEEFLRECNDKELKDIFALGIHEYQDEKYQESFDYPDIWIEESQKIDQWIAEHEHWLMEWKKQILLENKDLICRICI